MAGSISANMLNIGGPDPLQGFDVGVWVSDASNPGSTVLAGQFTSIVVTIRNATEAYLEFGARYPRYLDGEFQIAFVMEKGLVDLNVLQETFGFKRVSRNKRFGRSPRFEITFAANPVDGDILESVIGTNLDNLGVGSITRDVTGRIILHNCKMDSFHFASTAGRQVVAAQWQGVAEGYSAVTSDTEIISGLDTPVLTLDKAAGGPQHAGFDSYPFGIATTDTTFHPSDGNP